MSPWVEVAQAIEAAGASWKAWAFAWARVAPAIALVPAFGLRASPPPVRIALGLAMAVGISASVAPVDPAGPFVTGVLVQAAKGLPVAITAATALWVATMAGNLVDDLRGSSGTSSLPVAESGATPIGALLGMLAALAFLEGGGPARLAAALAGPDLTFAGPLAVAVNHLAGGIGLAVAVAAPVVVAALVFETASAFVTGAATPAYFQPLFAPLRSLFILGVLALSFDRMAALLVALGARS